MAHKAKGTNYTEVVFHVLRDARTPRTMDEIVAGVRDLVPVHAANPKALIQQIVEQSDLILPTEDGRYGYLPHLLESNAFRQPLPATVREQGFVELGPDSLTALWPGWAEARREHESRPGQLLLPNGAQARLQRHFRLAGHWGFTAGPEFWAWLDEAGWRPDDDLIIRVIDADARSYAANLLCRLRRDEQAIAGRNQEVADQAVLAVRAAGGQILVDRLAPLLIAAGLYRRPIPPDPLIAILASDGRFVDAGLGSVALMEGWSEADERLADMRQRAMYEAIGQVPPRFRRASPQPRPDEAEATFAQLVMEGRLEEAVTWLQRENRIQVDEVGEVTVDLHGLLDDLPGTAGKGNQE